MNNSDHDKTEKFFFDDPVVYAMKHIDEKERMASQSGGAFAVFSDCVLEENGIIYGCAFDESFKAIHIRADNSETRDRMRYSKYVQSDMQETFRNVSADLESGKIVLFSGTPCQVDGLNRYLDLRLKSPKGTLYTIDIVCHGVPSPLIWKNYLKWEKTKHHSEIKDVICRNKKKYGWKSHVTTVVFKNGHHTDSRVFPKIFYSHVALRPSCYRCPYKDIHRPSDITIADYWGIDKACQGFSDHKGVSLILVNSAHGDVLFNLCKNRMLFHQTRIEDSLQKPLQEPYQQPSNREMFWTDYQKNSFDDIARKYGNYSLYKNFKWKLRFLIKRIIVK